MDRSHYPTKRRHLRDPEDGSYVLGLTMAERMMMVWPLTLQAWAFHDGKRLDEQHLDRKGQEGEKGEPRLRRHVVRVVRGTS